MKNAFKIVFVLTVICVIAGGLPAVIYKITKEPIEKALLAEKMQAMKKVLPPYDNDPMLCTNVVVEAEKKWVFYVARKNGAFAGTAFEASSDQGYGGTITILVGIASNTVYGIEILEQKETPGLGAQITKPSFTDQFQHKNIVKTKWKVKKEGGDINAITGATISPRAVLDALRAGLKVYIKNQKAIANTKRSEKSTL